jgi:hypothetical protein
VLDPQLQLDELDLGPRELALEFPVLELRALPLQGNAVIPGAFLVSPCSGQMRLPPSSVTLLTMAIGDAQQITEAYLL